MKNQYKIKNNKEKREKNKFTSQNILAFSFLILALIRHGWRCRNALAEVFVKQKLQRQKTAWMLFFAACSLLICNCDLFNNPKDPDYLKKIDEEIAWANAAKLNVSVAIPAGWGTSPQNGENKCFDIKRATERPRKGYPFNVEFMPGYGYGFIGWLAFEFTEEFKLESINSLDFIDAKPYSIQEGVVISSPEGTFTGSYTANITLNVSKNTAITLVPWCSSRPQVIQSNPPLINTGALYSLGQTITVYFSEPGLIYEAGPLENFFGEGFIQIKGQTMPKQIDEKITIYENLSEYYHTPVYNDELKTITIHADSLPVEEMSITVTVGPDIKGKNDSLMAAPVSFSWRTSTETVKETYAAQNIWAAHSPDTVTGEEGFFYARAIPGENNNYRDARLRKNNDGKYEINLYFSVRSNNEDLGDPNRCMVQEYRAYTLAGSNASSVGDAATYEITAIASPGSDPAANAYRSSNNNVKAYKITHTMDPEKYETGIWRLVLMPYLDEGGVQIGLDTWGNAHSDNAYAVVVLNNTLPTGTPILSLNAEMSGTGIYNYGADNQLLNFDVNFNSIVDRWASSGIMRDDGSYEKPWTIDAFSELTWQWRIVDETDSEPVGLPSSWISTGTRESGSNLTGVLSSTQNIYNIELCFRDTLGQASENWLKINVRFTYYESNYGDVSNYQAIYNPAVNTITVEWENPAESDFNHVEAWYKENGIEVKRADLDNKATVFVIRNVPRLDASGVRDGAAVQNIYCYEIFMKTHSVIDSMPALSFKIWNFCTSGDAGSGMKTGIAAGFSEAVEVIDAGSEYDAANKTIGLAKIASHDLSGQYVLADNINLNGEWMPIGDGDAAFQGIFYGNGKIISTASDFSFADNTYTGIFGFVQDAVIRDLAVHYAFSVDVSADSYKYTGGIAGFAAADTVVRNCIVTGGESTILKVTIPVAVGYSTYNGVALGGIIGCMESGVKIINACSALDIELLYEYESTGENYSTYTYAGGAVGYIVGGIDPELDTVILSGIRITGNVSMQSYNISYCFGGGAVGYCNSNGGKLYDVSFGGNLIMGRKNTYESGSIYGGGIVGFCVNPRFEECTFEQTGKIITLEDIHSSSNGTFNNSNWLYISGIAGSMTGDGTLKSCTARGGIDIRSLSVIYAGGIVGELADSSIHFSECNYENGRIFAKTKNVGRICLGGIVGYEVVTWGTEFQNCFSIGGQFEIDVNVSNLWIGGFGGMI
ncbi:MAG: hypothetical protein FWH41_04285, partial [Treponema sp.]|nr:hypothetical protein [Treponema sp.]